MTDITELKQAVCAAIFESCGVLTLPDSGKSGKSPFFAVKASEGEGVVMDGGRQIERKVSFEVSCFTNDDDSSAPCQMGDKVIGAVMPYFRCGERCFSPLYLKAFDEGGVRKVSFDLYFCDELIREIQETELMGDIKLEFAHGIRP